jgi:hypothetical protein
MHVPVTGGAKGFKVVDAVAPALGVERAVMNL